MTKIKKALVIGLPVVAVVAIAGLTMASRSRGVEGIAVEIEQAGRRLIVAMTAHSAIGVHAKTGRLLWRFEHGNVRGTNCPTPIHDRGRLFLNSGAGTGGVMLKLHVDKAKAAEELAQAKLLKAEQAAAAKVEADQRATALGLAFARDSSLRDALVASRDAAEPDSPLRGTLEASLAVIDGGDLELIREEILAVCGDTIPRRRWFLNDAE